MSANHPAIKRRWSQRQAELDKREQLRADIAALAVTSLPADESEAIAAQVRAGLIRQHGSVSTGATWQRGRN